MLLTLQQIEEFEAIGEEDDPTARLLATVEIAGVSHHMEAIAVCDMNEAGQKVDYDSEDYDPSPSSEQRAEDPAWQEMLDDYYQACGGEGAFHTTEINGREYVLCITPFCQ
jgi:hypothetical protein